MDRDERKRKLMRPLELLGRYKYVLLVVALGALLLLWPERDHTAAGETALNTDTARGAEAVKTIEEDLEQILSKISGVGRVDVMLTVESSSELVLAEDTTLRYSGNTQAPDDYDRSSTTVTVTSSGGGQDVVVTRERYPQYRGALVVCDGGENDSVRLQVVEAVAALTGLGTDRIAVVKWQSGTTAGTS